MGKKFYCADLHLDHQNILKFGRPFNSVDEMNETLIANWNARVSYDDEVYVLGDFCFDRQGKKATNFFNRLNGKKYLIKGNHDHFVRGKQFDPTVVEWIKDYATIIDGDKVVVLFHYPIAVWDRQHYGSIHLYGHVHANTKDHHPLLFKLGNAYNVGVDVCDFEPKTLDELIAMNGYDRTLYKPNKK